MIDQRKCDLVFPEQIQQFRPDPILVPDLEREAKIGSAISAETPAADSQKSVSRKVLFC